MVPLRALCLVLCGSAGFVVPDYSLKVSVVEDSGFYFKAKTVEMSLNCYLLKSLFSLDAKYT